MNISHTLIIIFISVIYNDLKNPPPKEFRINISPIINQITNIIINDN